MTCAKKGGSRKVASRDHHRESRAAEGRESRPVSRGATGCFSGASWQRFVASRDDGSRGLREGLAGCELGSVSATREGDFFTRFILRLRACILDFV